MKPWSWFRPSWFPPMFPFTNRTEKDEDYYFYYPLCNVPFVYHKIECRSTLKPRPRSGHRIVSDSCGNIYCIGGYNPEGLDEDEINSAALFKELWKFNSSSLEWTKLKMTGDPPKLLCSFGALCIDDILFVHGGTGLPWGRRGCNKLYVCQLSTGIWKAYRLKSDRGDVPPKYYGQALVFDPDELVIYSVGGTCGHGYYNGVTRMSLRNGKAELLYPYNGHESTGSYRHEIVLHDNRIYQFGGGTQESCIGFEEIFFFDLSSNTWQSVKAFPDPVHGYPIARRFHGLVTLESQVFICGGGTIAANQAGPIGRDDVWRFNLITFEWTFICKLPSLIYFHSTAISPAGQMTIFGGVQSDPINGNRRIDDLATIWLKVPSLGELAWIAFLNNCVDITKITKPQLLDIGVPLSYANRLCS